MDTTRLARKLIDQYGLTSDTTLGVIRAVVDTTSNSEPRKARIVTSIVRQVNVLAGIR